MEFSRPQDWGSPSLLQGIFPIQGSNPGLPQGRWTLHSWATREAPYSYTKGQTSVVQSSVQLRDPIYCSSPGFWPSPSSLGVCSNSGPLSKGSMQSSCPRIDSWWWTGKPSAAVHGTAVRHNWMSWEFESQQSLPSTNFETGQWVNMKMLTAGILFFQAWTTLFPTKNHKKQKYGSPTA